jgi:hypothetical protein
VRVQAAVNDAFGGGTRCTGLTLSTWLLGHGFLQCMTGCARAPQVSDEVAKKQWTFWSALALCLRPSVCLMHRLANQCC